MAPETPILRSFVTAVLLGLAACATQPQATSAQEPALPAAEVVRVWPGAAPGTESWTGPEVELDADLPAGKVHIVTNVTTPSLTLFRPAPGTASGTAMLVLPGGAFRALAWDLEGTEVAQQLARRGIAAFVLRYRVRSPADGPSGAETFDSWMVRTKAAREIAAADARQALRLIRTGAARIGIAPGRVGMIGFSAGAVATMETVLSPAAADRPDFAAAIYGAAPADREPAAGSPPVFLVAAQDDPLVPFERSVDIHRRWSRAGLPAELHLYEKGGHGFGTRARNLPADRWLAAFEAWLASRALAPPPAPAERP
jgi:dienelactone hydrolase